MKYVYRDARAEDAPDLDRLFERSFCDTFAHLYDVQDLESFLSGFSVAGWEKEILDPAIQFRVAEAAGTLVGYVKLAPLKLPVDPNGPAVLLDQLYILKEHHGAGAAPELMDWVFKQCAARDFAELYLTVYTDNKRALRFYERYGFVAVGRYDFMVGKHADEDIIMRMTL